LGDGRLEAYRVAVERIFGEDLVSVTLYGGHALDPPEEEGDVAVLIVVRELRRTALGAYREAAPGFAKRGIPPPPIFTEEFLARSLDVFPLEFLAMKERRKVLSGRDVLADVRVDERNLRHQVEFEMKGKLLSLRRMYLATRGARELAGLLRNTAGPIVSVARGLLLLSGHDAPHGRARILSEIESRFGVVLPLLREIATAGDGKALAVRAEEIAPGYLEEVERLCAAADGFAGGDKP
jgi:predicted nucleotidyltransferase